MSGEGAFLGTAVNAAGVYFTPQHVLDALAPKHHSIMDAITNPPAKSEQRRAKAKEFLASKIALRKIPGNCTGCGKPNPSKTHKSCDRCRAYCRERLKRLKAKPILVDRETLNALTRRVSHLEHALARMQIAGKVQYNKGYCRGYKAGAAHERKLSYFEPPTISKQELATINHAYDRPE